MLLTTVEQTHSQRTYRGYLLQTVLGQLSSEFGKSFPDCFGFALPHFVIG